MNVYATYKLSAAARSDSKIALCTDTGRQMCYWSACGEQVCVKPYNINEYNISRLINNPDSLASREAYYPLARTDFFLLWYI